MLCSIANFNLSTCTQSDPSKQHIQRDKISTDKEPVCTKDILDDSSVDKCSPVREDSTKAARPCSPEVSKYTDVVYLWILLYCDRIRV